MKCTCGKRKTCNCKKGYAKGGLKMPSEAQSGLKKLPKAVRNKMGYMAKGGMAKKGYKDGGFCTGPAKGYKK